MLALYANNNKRRTFAAKLGRALNIPVFTPAAMLPEGDVQLINWGSSKEPMFDPRMTHVEWLLDTPDTVRRISNKIRMFDEMIARGVPCLAYTDQRRIAEAWHGLKSTVYERHVITGHSGDGIRVVRPDDEEGIRDSRLYTRQPARWPEYEEYRVHVINGETVVQQKRKMGKEKREAMGIELDEQLREDVRTYRNGWAFCVNNVEAPPNLGEFALDKAQRMGMSLGCVDIAVGNGLTIVIELNTAPALRSPTVFNKYVEVLKNLEV